MHCPLCKAQYRVGYDLCRGCDADLVFTKEQAVYGELLFHQATWHATLLHSFMLLIPNGLLVLVRHNPKGIRPCVLLRRDG
jgi:hypothetical protein